MWNDIVEWFRQWDWKKIGVWAFVILCCVGIWYLIFRFIFNLFD